MELHGKISAMEIMGANADELPTAKPVEGKLSPADEDAVSALMGLGFTRAESVQGVKKARELGADTVEEIILKALQGAL